LVERRIRNATSESNIPKEVQLVKQRKTTKKCSGQQDKHFVIEAAAVAQW
jgi:hypothetical protein